MNVKILSGSTIKIIAIISMFIDHFGQIVLKNGIVMNSPYSVFSDSQFNMILKAIDICHILGRIAFPIFCFLIVEGFVHTHDIKKYIKRLAIFAILSEPIYDLAFSGNILNLGAQNVFFTLLLGLLTISLIKKYNNNYLIALITIVISSIISYYCKTDGWYYGIILTSIFYLFREHSILKFILAGVTMYGCGLDFSIKAFLSPYFLIALSSLIFLSLYNGSRGLKMKYVFYVFYPGHLAILYLVTNYYIIPQFLH